MKKKTRGAWVLLLLLVVSSAAIFGTGAVAKAGSELYQDQPTFAVPFLLLRNKLDGTAAGGTSPVTQPEEPAVPTEDEREPASPMVTIPPIDIELPTVPATTAPEPTVPEINPPEPLAVYGEDESYFDDALFIGDSRVVGLSDYARLGDADYFASEGLTVFKLFSTWATDYDYNSTYLEDLLNEKQYGKIYLSLGLNEAGYPLDNLIEAYRNDLEKIIELQPDAEIYVIQIFGVSEKKASKTRYFGPENLKIVNDSIAELCEEYGVTCLDPRPVMDDEKGYLISGISGDGVHPYAKCYPMLAEWLCAQALPLPIE